MSSSGYKKLIDMHAKMLINYLLETSVILQQRKLWTSQQQRYFYYFCFTSFVCVAETRELLHSLALKSERTVYSMHIQTILCRKFLF